MITNPIFLSLFDNELQKNKTKRLGMIYSFYRIIIAVFFSLNFASAIQKSGKNLFLLINFLPTFLYLIFAIFFIVVYFYKPKNIFLMSSLTVDVLALSIMLYFSGGDDLQIILLFFVQVACSFMLVSSTQATLLTVFAISLILYQSFYQPFQKTDGLNYELFSDVGIVVASFVIVAYLSYTLSKRVKVIESLSETHVKEVNAVNTINKKIVQIIEQGVIVISHKLEIVVANDKVVEQLNLPTQIENFCLTHIKPDLADALEPIITHGEETLIYRQKKPRPNQETLFFTDYYLRITQLDKQYALILVNDLRREQAHAQQLKLASLGQLTASIAHEIRNPLASISYSSQMLIEEANNPNTSLPEENIFLYETIYKQTVRANQIIEDVLKLSRQQKPNQIFIEPCSWLTTFLKDNFKDHDVFLHCETDNCFLFDPHHLEQVLTNLIKNGLRFCSRSHPHAFVTLEVYHDARFVYIDVIDTGAGVAEHHIQDLFNPFFTTDNEGTGLGLYLSQSFCQANHADLEYVPEHEHTCFRIICDKKFMP